MSIVINKLYKKYDNKIIFEDFNIEFEENRISTILGKSGCGKTTLLKIISEIIKKDSGDISGVDVENISYIFQEDRLIEWLTVNENLKLVLKNHYKKDKLDDICNKYLNLVGIYEYKDYYPQKLSGGIRQRVNIARAFANPSKIIIMDEPFKSIDIKNKHEIMYSFNELLKIENRTVLFVTHDIEEAMYFDGDIYVLGGSPLNTKLKCRTIDVVDNDYIKSFI